MITHLYTKGARPVRRLMPGGSFLLLFVIGLLGYPYVSFSQQATLQICIVANPGDACASSSEGSGSSSVSSGGGGGGIFAFDPLSGRVTIRGLAYPESTVTLIRDGQIIARVQAGTDASFQFDLNNVTSGAYTYGVWSKDSQGNRSIVYTFTIPVANGVGTVINGIFLPPTISFDKSQVRQGDTLRIFGRTVPAARIHLTVDSTKMIVKDIIAGQNGSWTYRVDTSPLGYGIHTATSKALSGDRTSQTSEMIRFTVGDQTIAKRPPIPRIVDINSDGAINIVDFSIVAFWYKRPLSTDGMKADLNHDDKVDLRDFSILAYYWTG